MRTATPAVAPVSKPVNDDQKVMRSARNASSVSGAIPAVRTSTIGRSDFSCSSMTRRFYGTGPTLGKGLRKAAVPTGQATREGSMSAASATG